MSNLRGKGSLDIICSYLCYLSIGFELMHLLKTEKIKMIFQTDHFRLTDRTVIQRNVFPKSSLFVRTHFEERKTYC